MTEFEKQIYDIIAASKGVKGAEIAAIIGVDKKVVNSTLANSPTLKALVKQEPDFKWYLIAATPGGTAKASPKPDEDLQKICNYYLQCITAESSSSVSQFLTSKFSLEYATLSGLEINTAKDKEAIKLLNKISADKEKKAFLGYPIQIFTFFGKGGVPYTKIAPVFLFPVEFKGGKVEVSWVPTINLEVLGRYASGGKESLVNELVDLQTALGMNNPDVDVEVDDLVLRLFKIRAWEWAEKIDPYNIPWTKDITGFKDGIYNRPVMISAQNSGFTAGLESELLTLSMMPEENYKGTALYAWIKDKWISDSAGVSGMPLLEVLPLNTEQSMAVKTALYSDLTIVTGPPGTGKSQVVTDLLTNIAWNENSALFSSRNNKAVDVVEQRANALSKRPFLLRLGANVNTETLADVISSLLNSSATKADMADLQFLQKQYDSMCSREAELKEQKTQIVKNRNLLDEAEQKYCLIRDVIGGHLFSVSKEDIGNVKKSAYSYNSAWNRSRKENNGFFAKLFWGSVEPKRLAELATAEKAYDEYAIRYGLIRPDEARTKDSFQSVLASAETFEAALPVAIEYRNLLEQEHVATSLEQIDRELSVLAGKRADLAQQIWDKWLLSKKIEFTPDERKEMNSFVAAAKLGAVVSPDVLSKMTRLATRYMSCWAVTSLSAKRRIPFEAGLFDYVIIDEASQCDIASIIPLLFRAKHAVIIGDPQQLQHISQLTKKQDLALIQKYNIDPVWSYSANSLYAIATAKVDPDNIIQLRDHFRSCAEIIEFSNEVFYDGTLRTATRYDRLKPPPGGKPGVRWIDVKGKTIKPGNGSAYNQEEIARVVKELRQLVLAGYKGSIGVTTPFRLQADSIMQALEKDPDLLKELVNKHEFLADTVHKFQGDERDLMLFSSVVTGTAPAGTVGFLKNTGNLFNVAITRARAMLVVVGDYSYCSSCDITYLKRFAQYCYQLSTSKPKTASSAKTYTREYPRVSNLSQVSDWEKILYTALFDAGLRIDPQYPADRYCLDLALILPNGRKLDIEVDGEMYHRSWNKELCYRDQLRNQRMFELGWDVKRFWVYQVRDDLDWCVKQVLEWCEAAKNK